jgi:glycosyltransferase involved in cell wall biosynthesis
MDQVKQPIIAPAIQEAKIIPHGVDLDIFHPSNKQKARIQLGLPLRANILLFTAVGARNHPYKDYQTVLSAVISLSRSLPDHEVLLIILGDKAPSEKIGKTEIRFVPLQEDLTTVAQYYQAADVYLHAARADNFPNSILEALACGTPVVATAVGGIPEQIKSLKHRASCKNQNLYFIDTATGILVPPNSPDAMAKAVETLILNEPQQKRLGKNAAQDAKKRFDLNLQAERYLAWYKEIIKEYKTRKKNTYL